MRSIFSLFLASVFCFTGCRKKPDPVPPVLIDDGGSTATDGHLRIVFENVVGSVPLQLDTAVLYTNAAGNIFSVSIYRYYISNIKIWRADGTSYTELESYHLINEALASSKSFTLHDVPAGDYQRISFIIGVDSARNTIGAQTGALDPMNGMYWDWNTGYIMAKLEGKSPQSAATDSGIVFHMGGFGGQYSVLRTVSLQLPQLANVTENKTPSIHIKSDVLEWFRTPTVIDFTTDFTITDVGKNAAAIASNYSDMFTVDHVEN
ncbi:MAG TPA: MbnP family protein [Flavipsychrobacter sp.]|nr:MbnP family protein [Flavipsychrobacter sp.]